MPLYREHALFNTVSKLVNDLHSDSPCGVRPGLISGSSCEADELPNSDRTRTVVNTRNLYLAALKKKTLGLGNRLLLNAFRLPRRYLVSWVRSCAGR